jgi:hypothetical protein
LRGQFDDVNSMASTEPYVQTVAESLAGGVSRPSTPIPDHPTFEFALEPQVVFDLVWLREVSILVYQLHATMKRAAKGQNVVLIPHAVPRWEPDQDLDDAIEDYDPRSERESNNLLRAVGVATRPASDVASESVSIGGLVPHWFFAGARRAPKFDRSDPLPALFEWFDLDVIGPLRDQSVLDETHAAIIALLWACFNIATREPERAKRRLTTPFQWGYMVTPTESFLLRALDEIVDWVANGAAGGALAISSLPTSGSDVLDVLGSLDASIWPPLCGSPVHQAGQHSLVDLVGASRRLFATLVRPPDGPYVNLWSTHFEQDVQATVDATPWRPEGALRALIGRTIRSADGTALTDIDALAHSNGQLLLISCKSIAFTIPASRGEFNITRNIREKTHDAAREWDQVVRTVRADMSILKQPLSGDVNIAGCVVFPSLPFFTEKRWRRTAFGRIPYLSSISELQRALETA